MIKTKGRNLTHFKPGKALKEAVNQAFQHELNKDEPHE